MDHVGVVVDDLDAAVAFFTELGMELQTRTPVAGRWVDGVCGLDGVRVEIAMMRTPDGHNRLELMVFDSPAVIRTQPEAAPPNTLGLRNVMFTVGDIEDTIARLHTHGAELIGELADFDDAYRLCYLRGPAGVIVALAQPLGG